MLQPAERRRIWRPQASERASKRLCVARSPLPLAMKTASQLMDRSEQSAFIWHRKRANGRNANRKRAQPITLFKPIRRSREPSARSQIRPPGSTAAHALALAQMISDLAQQVPIVCWRLNGRRRKRRPFRLLVRRLDADQFLLCHSTEWALAADRWPSSPLLQQTRPANSICFPAGFLLDTTLHSSLAKGRSEWSQLVG